MMQSSFSNLVRPFARYQSVSRFCTATKSNFQVIKNYEQYMDKVKSQEDDKLVVAFFNAEFSNAGKKLTPEFVDLAKQFPQHQFLQVDVDTIPRAAYHAEVVDVPSVIVMNRDDVFRSKIAPIDYCEFDTVISRARDAIQSFQYDPNAAAGQSSWDHHIRKDNLCAVDMNQHVLQE